MQQRECRVQIVTPAFMGNAHQSGQWRTPPFKALLRQWWRIIEAEKVKFNAQALHQREGELFGFAGTAGAKRSTVQLRLGGWSAGNGAKKWDYPAQLTVNHPETKFRPTADVYLGFGPVLPKSKKNNRERSQLEKPAIEAKSSERLLIRTPDGTTVGDALLLMHWFGTIGGRSRNGWGSFVLEGEGLEPLSLDHPLLKQVSRNWKDCMCLDWPHAIGRDENGLLIWETEPVESWERVMKQLAQVKIDFRTLFKFSTGKNGKLEERHVLAYPVTNHNPRELGNSGRNANQIRFKVVKDGKQFKGRIFHLPCGVPEFADKLKGRQETVWKQVHQQLDDQLGRLQ